MLNCLETFRSFLNWEIDFESQNFAIFDEFYASVIKLPHSSLLRSKFFFRGWLDLDYHEFSGYPGHEIEHKKKQGKF